MAIDGDNFSNEALLVEMCVAIILHYFTTLNYELIFKHNGIPAGAHFIYLNSGSLLGLKMAKKIAEKCRRVNN